MDKIKLLIEFIVFFVTYMVWRVLMTKKAKYHLNIIQLNEYNNDKYRDWIKNNFSKAYSPFDEKTDSKTPLVMTDRAKRLLATYMNVYRALVVVVLLAILCFTNYRITVYAGIIFLIIALFIQPQMMLLANSINLPKEKKINMGFYTSAQDKIKRLKAESGLKVIGITGSFGKTSVKFFTSTMLDEKFRVQNTPSSYNTPMGLSKVINNELDSSKEIFLAELGAYKPGEIHEVASLVQPDIGVITAIGPTHMQMYKTIENIMKTKYELIEDLDENGTAIFNYDNEYVRELADKTTKKTIRYGTKDFMKLDYYAKDIEVSERGSTFTLVSKEKGSIECTTKLLGEHSVQNLLASVAIGMELGMTLEEVKDRIEKIESVEHRLNLIEGQGGVIVIDDAFNSNPVGFRAALKVLSQFKAGKKIIITPGMVELGDMEEEENYKVGKEIAKVCDYAILVGIKRTEPIKRGLIDSGFDEGKIISVRSLNDATAELGKITAPRDVVLFENDLPDSYEE